MSNILETIQQELVSVQKSRDEVAVSTLRLLISEIKNAQIAKGEELTDEEVTGQIQKEAKKRKESIDAYSKAGRDDLVGKEKAELKVLEKYLPKQMSEDEVSKVVDEVIESVKPDGISDMGKVMGQVMVKLKGKADGGLVSAIVKKQLMSDK